MAVMRRLFAVNLFVALLGPWIAALSGTAVVVPCPMHRTRAAGAHAVHTMAASHHNDARHHHDGPDHGTSARGCNCAGECGRSGAAFSLAATELVAIALDASSVRIASADKSEPGSVAHFLPPATGPPQHLRI
jgi:hypothetical protein